MSVNIDTKIAEFVNSLGAGTFIDSLTQFISGKEFLMILWLVLGLSALVLDKKRGKKVFIAVLIATAIHFFINEGIMKHLSGNFFELRVRPYIDHPDLIRAIGKKRIDASFPSSHMASTAAILTVFTCFYRKIWPIAALFILAMGFARIHNGMHYLTDVIAGSIFGTGYGILAICIMKKTKG